MSKIYVNDIIAEDLLTWFDNHISSSGGDGGGAICCGNPDEVSQLFIEHWRNENQWFQGEGFLYPKDEYVRDGVRFINYHGSNESYIFCDKEIDLGFGDYSFIVIGDCKWGWVNQNKSIIKKI